MKHYVESINIESGKIANSLKIGAFYDLHLKEGERDVDYIKSIIKKMGELEPAYITGLGDYYYGHKKTKFFMRDKLVYLLHGLREIAPVVLSLGNHDLTIQDEDELRKSFRNLAAKDIYTLDNESIEFDDVYFSGYFAPRKAYAVSEMSKKKTNIVIDDLSQTELNPKDYKFSVLISHIPFILLSKEIMKRFPNLYGYDLVLSGHCHNGLYSLKAEEALVERLEKIINKLSNEQKYSELIEFLESLKSFGLITGPSPFTRYARGLHDVNGTELFISRGVTGQNKKGDSFISEINLVRKLNANESRERIY